VAEGETLLGAEHVRRYRETGGTVGHRWRRGTSTLLLTTTGKRSGIERTAPLIYGRDGENYVVVASRGGAPASPAWYWNLVADPHVELQVLDEVFPAEARTAAGEERERLWRLMAEVWPSYDEYAARTQREIPVVVLEPRR
jgi:deazaflavin-dependent oxidoreductase (nitroreductase family)